MVEEKKLTERLKEFEDRLKEVEKAPKEKKFKITKLSKSKLKKGYVIVELIKENNYVEFRKLQVINGNVHLSSKEEDTYHLSDAEYIGMIGKFPLIILPAWSNEPLTKEVLTRKVEENKSTIKPQKQIIHLMEDARIAELAKPKKGMKGLIIIGAIIAIIYFIGKGRWF